MLVGYITRLGTVFKYPEPFSLLYPCDILDPRRSQVLTGHPEHEVQGCAWHHCHHGEDRGSEEPLQRSGGGAAQTDKLLLGPDRLVRHHETVLHQRVRKYVTQHIEL